MTTTAQARRELYERLVPTLGETTDTLMELLPLHPTSELATREDVQANTAVLRGEMAELRGELRGEMVELRAGLRGEMAELRTGLRGEMAELRTGLCGEMAELRTELRGDMSELRTDMAKLEGRLEAQMTQSHAEITLLVSSLRDEFISRRANTAWTILGTSVAVLAAVLAYIQLFGL